MRLAEGSGRPNPLQHTSLWSYCTFGYIYSILEKGYKGHKIEPEDVFKVSEKDSTNTLCSRLEREWLKEWMKHKSGQKASFAFALVRTFWRYFMVTGIFLFLEALGRFSLPILFGWVLAYFSTDSHITVSQGWMCTIGIVLNTILQAFSGPQIVFRLCSSANRWQVATVALIYRKILRISKTKLGEITTGHIVDLVASDSWKYHHVIWFIHGTWIGPLSAIAAFWYLYRTLGGAIVVGYVAIVLLIAFQGKIAKMSSKVTERLEKAKDERVQLMSEIITGMRIIKMYCWEKPFGSLLSNLRASELKQMWLVRVYGSFLSEMWTFNFRLISASVVVSLVLMGYKLEASKIFPMFAMFNVINDCLLNIGAWGLKSFFECMVSVKRIERFLLCDEKSDDQDMNITPDSSEVALSLLQLTAKWDPGQDVHTLDDVSLSVKKGELIAIVGEVGSGKSSLLNAVTGELHITRGHVARSGTLSYASQQPWIFSDTLRQNVLFGSQYNPLVFNEVMGVTALKEDMDGFSYGELTRIGDRGITLSGGQKARLCLARAVYKEADVYLLDDPLSAVDTVVGRHIFEKCIKGYLKSRTRILVTHQLQYLKEVDRIYIMDKGTIVSQGTYEDLQRRGVDFGALLPEDHVTDNEQLDNKTNFTLEKTAVNSMNEEEAEVEEGDRWSFNLGWKVYRDYFTSQLSYWQLLLLLILNILCQTTYTGADWWLAIWMKNYSTDSISHRLTIFILLTLGVFVIGFVRALVFFRQTIKISKTHHDNMYLSVIRSPTRFFDTNPSGRILNRFSSDIGTLDGFIPDVMYDLIQQCLILAATLCVVIYLNPMLVVPAVLLAWFLYRARSLYLHGSTGTVQLESIARSPLLSHFKASIDGVDTIRSLTKQTFCIDVNDSLQCVLHGRVWTALSIYNWYNFRMNITVAIFVSCTIISFVFGKDYLDPTLAAMTLSYLVPTMWYLNTVGRLSSEISAEMTKVDRVLGYCKLPSEAPVNGARVEPSWPQTGAIILDAVSLRYHDTAPWVLKDVSVKINAGEKIGLVGRTGAGKSSLIQALFRMVEPQGKVYIDGVNTALLGLHDVRRNMSIIPQDPVLFSGPVRRNLDPFQQHDDVKIWQALKQVQMDQPVRQLSGSLDSPVSEGGSNFSVGQRQLLCLARAILKHTKILIMDEATANVDTRTDELIQEAIRKTFQKCTVITVAHRLNTVMDCDKILVLQGGRVVEFDTPNLLLQKQNGALSVLVAETGKAEQHRLKTLAEESFNKKQKQLLQETIQM